MPSETDIKRERLHLRLDARSKQLLERAAGYSHTSVSDFVLKHALEAAESVVKDREEIVLSAADWDALLDALENPPEPNEALRAAFGWYVEHVRSP